LRSAGLITSQTKRPGMPGKENLGENRSEPGLFTENLNHVDEIHTKPLLKADSNEWKETS
jgi:hypothetical protein